MNSNSSTETLVLFFSFVFLACRLFVISNEVRDLYNQRFPANPSHALGMTVQGEARNEKIGYVVANKSGNRPFIATIVLFFSFVFSRLSSYRFTGIIFSANNQKR